MLLLWPDASTSPWIGAEIEHWLETRGSSENIRLVLVDDLAWNDVAEDFDRERSTAVPGRSGGRVHRGAALARPRWARDKPDHNIRSSARLRSDLGSRELVSRDRYELAGHAVARAYARNGEIASLAVTGDVLRAWGVIAGAELTRDEPLVAVSVASDGARIGAASSSGGVRRWDVATGWASVVADTGRALMAAAFAPDGSVLAVGPADGDVELWDTTDGAVVTSINTAGPVTAFTWSPTGSLVPGAVDGNVQIWDAAAVGRSQRRPARTPRRGGGLLRRARVRCVGRRRHRKHRGDRTVLGRRRCRPSRPVSGGAPQHHRGAHRASGR